MEDPIVEEVRRLRDEYAAQFNYNLAAICADLKRIGRESNEPRVSFGPRHIARPGAVAPAEPAASTSPR